jgi:hypothetical protein
MKAGTRKTVQIVLAVALVAAGVRLLLVYRSRHAPAPAESRRERPLDADYYVVPKKLHAYDLQSARDLTRQPAWVREGYRYTFYPYDSRTRHADFRHEAGTLAPIEKLQITGVVLDRSPREPLRPGAVRANPNQRQVMAVFQKDGKDCAVPIGLENNGDYQIYSDEMLYIQDPRELYRHWPPNVWQAIEQHRVEPGMNELQAVFAVGYGVPEPNVGELKTVHYPNGGRPLVITYRNGRAIEIKQGS